MPVCKPIARSPECPRVCEPSFEHLVGRYDVGADRTLCVRRLVPLEQDSPPRSPVYTQLRLLAGGDISRNGGRSKNALVDETLLGAPPELRDFRSRTYAGFFLLELGRR